MVAEGVAIHPLVNQSEGASAGQAYRLVVAGRLQLAWQLQIVSAQRAEFSSEQSCRLEPLTLHVADIARDCGRIPPRET